ncbi:MAG: histidine phosphatase family protein [Marinibacterium sp.]|nr:histidine phosphatase family protein [Marinibacterium sp.]
MTRLFLVRHGPTHAKSMVGWADLPADLSDSAALDRLNAYLPGDALVVSSDLRRAITTADAVAGQRPRLPHRRALREMFFGRWELRRFTEIEAVEPDLIRAFWETPGLVRAPGGESWSMLQTRADAAIDRLLQDHPGRDLVVVCHFGLILTQVQRALQIDTETAFAQKIDNLSVSEIHISGGGWEASVINHLP